MIIRLKEVIISCKQSQEVVSFDDFTYFYGKMGAGKSSIARLIDYCFGGDLDFTPALQCEFVAVTLNLLVNECELILYRQRGSNQIRAQWLKHNQLFDAVIPARDAKGEIVPDTGIEVLSDLVFYLADIRPPKVRRSKLREDSELSRLSLRDLLWYCYLDQDSMDSSFFNLDAEAHWAKRLKSRDVLRFIIGFHQEQVAELETQLEDIRERRLRYIEGARALKEALAEANIASEVDIQERIDKLQKELSDILQEIQEARENAEGLRGHAVDRLSQQGRQIAAEIESVENAIKAVETVISEDKRHLNEIITLSIKFRRANAARAVLSGVEFEVCPRCARALPHRLDSFCRLCGQLEQELGPNDKEIEVTEKDISARKAELEDAIKRHEVQLIRLKRSLGELKEAKSHVDAELNAAMRRYDSAYLSSAILLEHRRASIEQEVRELEKLKRLPLMVEQQMKYADSLAEDESRIRRELKEVREAAEQDTANLHRLEKLFLDCLVRAKIPGFKPADQVSIKPPHFMPEVYAPETGDIVVTSFSNLGSGGKKTLFKCCFAIAIHRLAVQVGALLPRLLIIDSPMKNISERENREQFVGFHELLYELATSELRGIQFILIDKEFCAPPKDLKINLIKRHMTPEDPLISYYRGH